MAARFRALSNDNISPDIGCSEGLVDGMDLADERHTGLAGVIGARMIGCSMSKNFVNRVLIITASSSCGEFDSLFSLRGGYWV
jgi:hypothetical protein